MESFLIYLQRFYYFFPDNIPSKLQTKNNHLLRKIKIFYEKTQYGGLMTTKELYEVIGGNYEKMKENVKTDERITRFARMFLDEGSFHELELAMNADDYKEAFQAAHKLKGICQNMFFEKMYEVVFELTEGLRNCADIPVAKKKFIELKELYTLTTQSITQLT